MQKAIEIDNLKYLLIFGVILVSSRYSYSAAADLDVNFQTIPGFPTTEDRWQMQDFVAARDFLVLIAEDDAQKLPQTKEKTGHFDRLFNEISFRLVTTRDRLDDEPEIRMRLILENNAFLRDVIKPVLVTYQVGIPQGKGLLYEQECLLLVGTTVRSYGLGIYGFRLIAGDNLENWQMKPETISGLADAGGQIVNGTLKLLVNPGYKHPELRKSILSNNQDMFAQLLWMMPAEDRAAARQHLNVLRERTKDAQEIKVIDALLGIDDPKE